MDPSFVLVSKHDGKFPWISQPNQIDFNHAIPGRHVVTTGKTEFIRKKPWGNIKSTDEDGLINPYVDFTMAWNCDEDPEEIIERIGTEFKKVGGIFLKIKNLASFKLKTAARIFQTHNDVCVETREYELREILSEARSAEERVDQHYEHGAAPVPDFQQRLAVPKIPGMDTSMFEGWPDDLKNLRKVIHVEVDANEAEHLRSLVDVAKKHEIVKKYWGDGVHLSAYNEKPKRKDGKAKGLSGKEKKALAEFSRKHVLIQSS